MELLEGDPFIMTIIAPRGSGKSFLTRTILQNGLIDNFDHIHILCPSLKFNKDYEDFKSHDKFKFHPDPSREVVEELFYEHSKLKESLKYDDVYDCPDSLIIFDDCIDSNVLSFKGVVDKIAERGRHINISAIIMSQRLSAVSRSIRINSTLFIMFSPFSISETEKYVEQFIPRSLRKGVIGALEEVYREEYNFLIHDNTVKDWREKLKYSNADDFVNNYWEYLEIKPPKKQRKTSIEYHSDNE